MKTNIYDMATWTKDGEFKATPGQEVSEEVYNDLLQCVPPLSLPRMKAKQALQDFNIPVHKGFLMGEPRRHDKDGALYSAFGMNDYGLGTEKKEPRYYYLGLSHEEKKLNGFYYLFDCMNAFLSNRLFEAKAFSNDKEAIAYASNYEANLYKYEYKNDEMVNRITLYEPQF